MRTTAQAPGGCLLWFRMSSHVQVSLTTPQVQRPGRGEGGLESPHVLRTQGLFLSGRVSWDCYRAWWLWGQERAGGPDRGGIAGWDTPTGQGDRGSQETGRDRLRYCLTLSTGEPRWKTDGDMSLRRKGTRAEKLVPEDTGRRRT